MPYETDPIVLRWFARSLTDERPMVRRRALELLEYVDCPERLPWLRSAESDTDDRVAAIAVLVRTLVEHREGEAVFELIESELAEDGSPDLEWEWEYTVKVCRGTWVPSAGILAWSRAEDDSAAKQMAMMKAFPACAVEADAVPVIVRKRLVTKFTRSPRNQAEAVSWRTRGRPKYEET